MHSLICQPKASHFIDGAFVEDTSGALIESINSATGEVIARLHSATPDVIESAVSSAIRAQKSWKAVSPAERGRVLRRAADIIRQRNRELSELETRDTGKPLSETLVADAVLGWPSFVAVVGLLLLTIAIGLIGARLMNERWEFGLLTGGAVAICGASAALALAAILPDDERGKKDALFTVVCVTTLSTIAMVLYPILLQKLNLTDAQSGFIIGSTIHDVAQVVRAGYTISEDAGQTATIVKLIRVSMLPLVLFLVIAIQKKRSVTEARAKIPTFLIGFLVLACLNSLSLIPNQIVDLSNDITRWALVVSISALGVKTSVQAILATSKRHFVLIVAETVILLFAAFVVLNFIPFGN